MITLQITECSICGQAYYTGNNKISIETNEPISFIVLKSKCAECRGGQSRSIAWPKSKQIGGKKRGSK
jgi:hypothetical protein